MHLSNRALLSLVFIFVAAFLSPAFAADQRPAVGDEAKDFELPALVGEPVKLSTLTSAQPVVLVVLRGYPGYQCPLCTRQFAEFMKNADALKQTGALVVFVYPGPAEELNKRAGEFVKDQKLPDHFRFVLDPDYRFTNAYGLRWDQKNETAYPSTFVIDRNRKITYAKISAGHGDRSNVEELLKVLGKQ